MNIKVKCPKTGAELDSGVSMYIGKLVVKDLGLSCKHCGGFHLYDTDNAGQLVLAKKQIEF